MWIIVVFTVTIYNYNVYRLFDNVRNIIKAFTDTYLTYWYISIPVNFLVLYLKKKAAAFKTLYACKVNRWAMKKVQKCFSDVSNAPLPRNFMLQLASEF
jgi:hypothetical protein